VIFEASVSNIIEFSTKRIKFAMPVSTVVCGAVTSYRRVKGQSAAARDCSWPTYFYRITLVLTRDAPPKPNISHEIRINKLIMTRQPQVGTNAQKSDSSVLRLFTRIPRATFGRVADKTK
jgi:hypothetical protein